MWLPCESNYCSYDSRSGQLQLNEATDHCAMLPLSSLEACTSETAQIRATVKTKRIILRADGSAIALRARLNI